MVLFLVLAVGLSGSLLAGDISDAEAAKLVKAAQDATTGQTAEVTLTITVNNVATSVVFVVFRDALGNATAKPKTGQGDGIPIKQVNLAFSVAANGTLTPVAMVVLGSGSPTAITKKQVTVTNGVISVSAADAVANVTKVTRVGEVVTTTTTDAFAASGFLYVTGTAQLPLPAGAESGKISVWQP
jgi:hypothetical protein